MKKRLDNLVVENNLLDSRKEAQTAIMDGWVLVNGEKVTKPGTAVDTNALISLKSGFKKKQFVSRGGFKLEKALDHFSIDVIERVCLDLGASTGGFTDCLLKRGAKKVYAVDVGYGQLDWAIRSDPRVVVKERQNARYLNQEILYGVKQQADANFACIDCSFISLEKIIPILPITLMDENRQAVCLVKPQFEAGKSEVGNGVIKDKKIHLRVLEKISKAALAANLILSNVTYSPIKGPSGNIEYLILLEDHGEQIIKFDDIVDAAFNKLNQKE